MKTRNGEQPGERGRTVGHLVVGEDRGRDAKLDRHVLWVAPGEHARENEHPLRGDVARLSLQDLAEEVADHAMMLGYSRRTSEFSRFNLNAAYAPSDYLFGGNVLGVAGEDLGQDLEVEAVWTLDF